MDALDWRTKLNLKEGLEQSRQAMQKSNLKRDSNKGLNRNG
jgi:hypothetical protein